MKSRQLLTEQHHPQQQAQIFVGFDNCQLVWRTTSGFKKIDYMNVSVTHGLRRHKSQQSIDRISQKNNKNAQKMVARSFGFLFWKTWHFKREQCTNAQNWRFQSNYRQYLWLKIVELVCFWEVFDTNPCIFIAQTIPDELWTLAERCLDVSLATCSNAVSSGIQFGELSTTWLSEQKFPVNQTIVIS